jgi:hypothetical protein
MRPASAIRHVAAVLALGVLASVRSVDPAAAQSGPACSSSSCYASGVFDPDDADVKVSDTLRDVTQWIDKQIKAPDPVTGDKGCYPPKAVSGAIFQSAGSDPEFGRILGRARAQAADQYFQTHGIPGGTVDWSTPSPGEGQNDGGMAVAYRADRDPPVLKASSRPDRGTLVKEKERIVVTIAASERHADGHRSWPTGVQGIQVLADDGRLEPGGQYQPPEPCKRQTLEVTYTVPADPPPVVHLRMVAEDGVGHESTEDADFPTSGDWYGTLTGHAEGSIYDDRTVVRFSFSAASDGAISGRGRAETTSKTKSFAGYCETMRSVPNVSTFAIGGRRVGDEFHLELPNKIVKIVISSTCRYPDGRIENKTGEGTNSVFLGLGAGGSKFLQPKVPAKDGATNDIDVAGAIKVDGRIEVHRVKRN